MRTYLFTFCVDIGKHSRSVLLRCLSLLIDSIHNNLDNYVLICYTNFVFDSKSFDKYNIKFKQYYDKSDVKNYDSKWLNLSFNKINIYKDLYDKYKVNFIWIDLDTILCHDISYVNHCQNIFIETGCKSERPNILFTNNNQITVPRNRYIQGNFWKINIEMYHKLMTVFNKLKKSNLTLKYDLQDLFSYYIYIHNKGDTKGIDIIGNNIMEWTANGLCVWDDKHDAHPNIEGLENLYYDNSTLRSKYFPEKEIHILSFTFDTLKKLWDTKKFLELFAPRNNL